jgi:hypothetical protein
MAMGSRCDPFAKFDVDQGRARELAEEVAKVPMITVRNNPRRITRTHNQSDDVANDSA